MKVFYALDARTKRVLALETDLWLEAFFWSLDIPREDVKEWLESRGFLVAPYGRKNLRILLDGEWVVFNRKQNFIFVPQVPQKGFPVNRRIFRRQFRNETRSERDYHRRKAEWKAQLEYAMRDTTSPAQRALIVEEVERAKEIYGE